MKIKADFAIGKIKPNDWAGVYGVYGYDTDEDNLYVNYGEIFVVLRLSTKVDGVNLEMIAKFILRELQEKYYSKKNEESNLMIRLEEAAWSLRSKMETILDREEKLKEDGLDFELALTSIKNNILYAVVIGESRILIKREEKIIDITEALVDAEMTNFLKSGSLELQDTDRVALHTSKSSIFKNEINLALETLNKKDLEEKLLFESGAAILFLADENDVWQEESITDYELREEEHTVATENSELETDNPEPTTQSSELSADDSNDELHEIEMDPEAETTFDELEGYHSQKEKIKGKLSIFKSGALDKLSKIKNIRKQESVTVPDLSADRHGGRQANYLPEEDPSLEQNDSHLTTNDEQLTTHNPQLTVPDGRQAAHSSQDEGSIFGDIKGLVMKIVSGIASAWNKTVVRHLKGNKKTYAHILNSIGSKIKSIFNGIKNLFFNQVVGNQGRKSYLNSDKIRRNRKIMIVSVILISVILFFSVRKAVDDKNERDKKNQSQTVLVSSQNRLDDLTKDVDDKKNQNPATKTVVLNELNSLESESKTNRAFGYFEGEWDKLITDINLQKDELLLVESVSQPQIVADIGKFFADSKLSDIEYSNGSLFVSDKTRNVIYKVGVSIGSTPEEFVSGLTNPYLLVKDQNGDIIFYDEDKTSSIGKISATQKGQMSRFNNLGATIVGSVTEVGLFDFNNALYEMHSNNQQIFKREPIADGYTTGGGLYVTSNPPNWKTDAEFSSALDIAVPSEIYVLMKGKGIKRYLAGGNNDLSYANFVNLFEDDFNSFKDATAFDVKEGFMAVADPVNKRVMIFENKDNNMQFLKQFVYQGSEDTFQKIEEVVVDSANRKVYVLDGNSIIRLGF